MKGFHANDKERCEKFLSNYEYLIISEDTDFLGNGMYFWEYLERAQWWKDCHPEKEVIVSAEIITDNLLDLKSRDVCKRIQHLYEKVDNSIKRRYLKNYPNMDFQTGVKLNILFESCGFYMNSFTVIRGSRKYDTDETLFLEKTKLTVNAVDIYCIRIPEVAKDRGKIV